MKKLNSNLRAIFLLGSVVAWATTSTASEGYFVDPNVVHLVKEMSEYLASAKQVQFRAEVVEEGLVETGEKVHVIQWVEVAVQRPDRFWAQRRGTESTSIFMYNGESVSVLDLGLSTYAIVAMDIPIDDALDALAQEYGVLPPLSHFLRNDPAATLLDGVTRAFHAGHHPIRGIVCDHLVLSSDELEWQIWVGTGRHKVPVKFVINHKTKAGAPQYVAHFEEWRFDSVPDAQFGFSPPPGFTEIDLVELEVN